MTGQLVLSLPGTDVKIDHKSESLIGSMSGERDFDRRRDHGAWGRTTFSGTFDASTLTVTGAEVTAYSFEVLVPSKILLRDGRW